MFNRKQTRRAFLSIIFMITLLTACMPPSQNVVNGNWVIFSAKHAEESGVGDWFLPGGETAKYWTPTEEDVIRLEEGLAAFLQDHADLFNSPVSERLGEYYRQYLGFVLEDQNIIYANFFCNAYEMDWANEFVFVLDGGECYFQFKYDPGSGTFFDLLVNGEA